MPPLVSVTLVTYNSGRYIGPCLESVFTQQHRFLEVIVVDNASEDATREVLARYANRVRIIWNPQNIGFAAAQNQAIAASAGSWVLTLNPDVVLTPGFVVTLVQAAEAHSDPRLGVLCGKLLAMEPDLSLSSHALLDSAGIFFTPTLRHFDRGAGEPDNGKYGRAEYVFGASAAAALYRREMIEDVSVEGEFFDSDFFSYREDADVAWRAQLLDWKCLYVPDALGRHARTVHSWNRAEVAPQINMHSVKNRFLMRLKNVGASLYLRNLVPVTVRDLGVLGYCLLVEHSSLPAFWLLGRAWSRAWRKRRWIQQRRRVSDRALARWFRFRPVSFPAPERAVPVSAGSNQRLGVSSSYRG